MMKIKYWLVFLGAFIFSYIIGCKTQQQSLYEFPVEMIEPVKLEYKKLCAKGEILFVKNCAGCHVSINHGKSVIPDFSAAQLETYQIRISNNKHMMNVTEDMVSAEELGYIITFLTYKKKQIKK